MEVSFSSIHSAGEKSRPAEVGLSTVHLLTQASLALLLFILHLCGGNCFISTTSKGMRKREHVVGKQYPFKDM